MKLPKVNYKRLGVQSLGRKNIGIPTAQADQSARHATALGVANQSRVEGQARLADTAVGAMDSVVGELSNYQEQLTGRQKQTTTQGFVDSVGRWEADFKSRPYINSADIPAGITHSGAAQVASEEVYAQMRKQFIDKLIVDSSEQIGDPAAREDWVAAMDLTNSEQFFVNQAKSQKLLQGKIQTEQVQDISKLKNAGKFDEARLIVKGFAGSPKDKAKLNYNLNVDEEKYAVEQALNSDSPLELQAAINAMPDTEYLTPAEVNSYTDKLELKLSDNIDSAIFRETKAKKGFVAEFRAGVATGQVTVSDIKSMYYRADNKYYTAGMYASDLKSRKDYVKGKKVENYTSQYLLDNVGRGVDYSGAAKKAIDAGMEQAGQEFSARHPNATAQQKQQAVIAKGLEAVASWGIAPDALVRDLKGANISLNANQMTAGLELYQKINLINPNALSRVATKDLDILARAAAGQSRGLGQQEALVNAMAWDQMTLPQQEAQTERVRIAMSGKNMSTSGLVGYLKDMVEDPKNGYPDQWGLGDSYNIPLEMITAFTENVKVELAKTNADPSIAKLSAWNQIKRLYNHTTINGAGELTRKAITEVPEAWARKDMLVQGLPPDSRVVADATTVWQMEAGLPASYLAESVNKELGTVNFFRYTPDIDRYNTEWRRKQDIKARDARQQLATENALTIEIGGNPTKQVNVRLREATRKYNKPDATTGGDSGQVEYPKF